MANDTALQFDGANPFPEVTPPPAGEIGDCFVGTLEHVIMFAEDTGYAVLAVAVQGAGEEVKCVGNTVERPSEGLEYEFVGGWTNHPRYGRQFKFATLTACRPSDTQGLVRYLGSGVIKGIGAKLASVMVGYFGDRTLEVLDQCEESVLLRVPGIGRVKAAAIVEQWAEKVKYREVSIKLMSLGISAFLCVRIIKHFEKAGQDAWAGIMADPYCLTELWGVGFKTADAIGRKVGIGRQDPRRLRAATIYALQEARDGEGHCYLEKVELIGRVNKVCSLDGETVAMFLCDADGDLQLARSVVMEPVPTERELFWSDTYWLSRLHRDEIVLAARLRDLADTQVVPRELLPETNLQWAFEDRAGYPLTDEQLAAVYALLGTRLGVLTGGPGVGKAQPDNCAVLTPDGYVPMGSIAVGDNVIGSDGKPKQVLGVFPQGEMPVYRVTFSDRTSTECTAEHLWEIQNKRDRGTGRSRVITTAQMIENLNGGSRVCRMHLRMVQPIQFPERPVLVDPYLMGVLLGNGGMSGAGLGVSGGPDLMELIEPLLPEGVFCDREKNDQWTYRLTTRLRGYHSRERNSLIQALAFYDLRGLLSPEKHIPQEYMLNSAENRLALLQGLLDTDGSVEGSGACVSFSSTSIQLAKGVQFLAQSLGCKAVFALKNGRYNGAPHTSYRITISAPPGTTLFRLERKRCLQRERTKYPPLRTVRSVEYVRDAMCTCLLVDAKDHLYCTNDCILTHNTAITRALVMLAEAAGMEVALASPTGRAAKRLEEMTGHEAKTLHRLLGWSQSAHDFVAGPNNPLEHDLIIVDEASMVDVSLARALVEAIRPTHTQLLLVGDKDQLPSVGPGSVLNDVIKSGRAEVCELTQIMRQAEGSGIVADAHAVNHGKVPGMDTADCTFVECAEAERLQQMLLALAKGCREELQILTPMRKGPLGTVELNRVLQAALNPPAPGKPELVVGKGEKARTYRLGDRVLQTRNCYDKEVMNGDLGTVSGVDASNGEITIQFAHTSAVYGRQDLSDVDLAYALTIHKSQGGEYTNVITIAHWSHYIMHQRNLLYTALTRAKTKATVIGEMRAVERCVSNNKPSRRNTRLSERMAN